MASLNDLSTIYRQSQETLAIALMHQAARRGQAQGQPQREGLPLPVWTARRRAMLMPERPFDLTQHRYLTGLYACTAREMVVYKAGQLGVSEYLVSYALHAADDRKATVLYVMPTDGHVSDFSSARIGPAIEASPYLAAIVVEGGRSSTGAAGGKRGADRVTLKRVRNRFIYLRGAQVDPNGNANQLKSIDADAVIFDEMDEMDPRAIPIAEKRLGHSAIGEVRKVSTPTYGGFGIHAEWLRSDQREWFVRCAHCGERQPLRLANLVLESDQLERPVRWHGQADGKPYLACARCQQRIDPLGAGEWVAHYPERAIAGFHVTKWSAPTLELNKILEALQSTDQTVRKECINQDLAEPYHPVGGQLTAEQLDAARREYAPVMVRDEATAMGVDVGRVLHVVIRAIDAPGRPLRFAGIVESWERLKALHTFYHVRSAVIDALPETTKAREFQAQCAAQGAPLSVWLAYYTDLSKAVEPRTWQARELFVNMDRTRSLDEMYAALLSAASTLPINAREIPDYYDHLTAPVRVVRASARGLPTAVYLEGSKPDHFAHAENYCHAAFDAPHGPQERTLTSAPVVHTADGMFS